MKSRKIISMILAAVAALSLCLPAFAASSLEDQVLAEVTSLYDNDYDISDTTAQIVSSTENEDGSTTYLVDASFKRTLKETSASDMPYIQGLKEAAAELTDPVEIAAAEDYIAIWTAELEGNYIGVAQDTNVTLSVTIPQGISTRSAYTVVPTDIQVFDDMTNNGFPLESIQPKSDAELREDAQETIAQVAENADVQQMSTYAALSPIQYYDRIAARNYARKWSCDSGSSKVHESCHNPDYKFYAGSDCANFVSQCIHEGGLEIDDAWYPYSSTWTTTGNSGWGLRQYLTGTGYFFHSNNVYDAFAGSVINFLNSDGSNMGHVGLIDQNDTQTITFCAHTSCRHSHTIPDYNRDFYVPIWDSYTGSWTVRH